ncbi:MAG: DMT family transporter [Proteobacteria bacterium]|nr:DMT family transporter [Pseudomonadota bacterium]MDA1357289.1 DMT family transporter [Pseudomonadota bacterium]
MLESAVFWGAGCAVVWGFSDYFARLAGRSVGAMAATFAVMAVGAVLIAAIMLVMGEAIDWRLDGLHWLLAIGAGTTIGAMLFFYAVTHGPLSLAAPMVASYPAVAVPISVALGARPGPIIWAAMVITLAGIWLVARTVSANGGNSEAKEYTPAAIRRTIIFSLAAASIFAASLTAADNAIQMYGALQTVLVVRLTGAFVLMIVVFGRRRDRARFPFRAWPVLVAFGVLDTLGHLFLFFGIDTAHGEYAIVASVAYTAVTVLLARVFLREPVSPLQWAGVGLTVGGVAILGAFG